MSKIFRKILFIIQIKFINTNKKSAAFRRPCVLLRRISVGVEKITQYIKNFKCAPQRLWPQLEQPQ